MLDHPIFSESRQPVPDWLLSASLFLCALTPLVLSLKSLPQINGLALGGIAVAFVLLYLGWRQSPMQSPTPSRVWFWMIVAASVIAGSGALVSGTPGGLFWIASFAIVLFIFAKTPSSSKLLKHVLVPVMYGFLIMFSASAIGQPGIGAFPAVIGALFVSIIRATLDIEEDLFENHVGSELLEVQHHYSKRLAVTAVIFFLFGTVSLWPWLGEIYGRGYFWVMLFGVLVPLAFFWGRIRQPKIEGARTALIRFNRIAPILGVIHVIAFALS